MSDREYVLGTGQDELARLALLTAVLAGLAWLGAAPLLAGALGVVAARHLVLRRGKEA